MRNALLIIATLLVVTLATAHADYRTDQQKEKMRQIEWQLDHFDPNATRAPDEVQQAAAKCEEVEGTVRVLLPAVEPQVVGADRFQKAQRRYQELGPKCQALRAAATVHAQAAAVAAEKAAADQKLEAARAAQRRAFRDEVSPYSGTITTLAPYYDPELPGSGFTDVPELVDRYRKDLPLVHQLCQKYPGLTDSPLERDRHSVFDQPAKICAMAALGPDTLIKRVRVSMLIDGIDIGNNFMVKEIKDVLDTPNWQISDALQQLVFDHDAWLMERDKELRPKFAALDAEMPTDLFASIDEMVPRLREHIDKLGTTQPFEMPPYQDRAVEAMVKSKVPGQLKGATVLKIGSDYKDWQAYDEKTWVKSDATYDYYRVQKGKNRYKRGWMLLRFAGRPYCQAREWIAGRVRTGPVAIEWLAPGGLFVKCP